MCACVGQSQKKVCILMTVAICVYLPTTAQGGDTVPHSLKLQQPVLGKHAALMARPAADLGALCARLHCGLFSPAAKREVLPD